MYIVHKIEKLKLQLVSDFCLKDISYAFKYLYFCIYAQQDY